MGKTDKTPTPSTSKGTPSTKRSRPEDSPEATSPPTTNIVGILESINNKLSSFDARLALVEILHKEFQALRESVEFSQHQVETLAAENAVLRESVNSLTEETTRLSEENKKIKESIIELQARSMRENLVFSGIPEKAEEDPEATVMEFIQTHLKLPEDAVKTIAFHRVHRLGGKRPGARRPRPIVAKFEHFKEKELVKSRGRELRGTDFSVNDQFPKEILERRRVLFPIRKTFMQGGSRAVIAVDKLDGDGRKVLRSSIREFLCSEAMAALGIPSTRAASLVTSDLYVSRDPLNNGQRIRERCSVVLRLAPTFIRFGSFEIFLGRDEFSGLQGPSAGRNDIRAQLLDYIVETFYPHIQQAHSIRKDRNLAFLREVMVRTARLVAQWQCVGFCHGVLNTDNMSILGLTLDYGPFGFMDRFDPDFLSNASDKKRRYSYQAQPSVCRWNLARLADALGSELDAAEAGAILDEFMPTYEALYLSIMRKKLGLVRKEEAEDSELISDLLRVMYNTGADFTNTFRLLSRVPWPEEGDSELATVGPVVDLILEQCASVEELKVANKPTMEDRELAMILSLAQTNPVMFGMVADSPGVAQQLELMGRLKELLETDQDELKRKQRDDWIHWISRYRRRSARECDGTSDLLVIIKERLSVMNSSNPRVVLRNYITQNAIQAAEKGDFSEIIRLLKVLEKPYSDPEALFGPEACGEKEHSGRELAVAYDRKPPAWAQTICVT